MGFLNVPHDGLQVPFTAEYGPSAAKASWLDSTGKTTSQVLQLRLDDGTLAELIKSVRHGGNAPQLSFGKTAPSLHYGAKMRTIQIVPAAHPSYLYSHDDASPASLSLVGQVSHKVALAKASKELAGVDDALTKLQDSLASAKQEKESHKIKFLSNSASLSPPSKKTAAAFKSPSSKLHPVCPSEKRLKVLDNEAGRSPLSHFHTASDSVGQHSVTEKTQAIRWALIHLLAARPSSLPKIASKLRCSVNDATEIVQKIARRSRHHESRWELIDRVYKELDPWSFNYSSQEERQAAIDQSISALDRMRISATDTIWQQLLPMAKRGKGKTLSRLGNLHKGPIVQSSTLKAPIPSSGEIRSRGTSPRPGGRRDTLPKSQTGFSHKRQNSGGRSAAPPSSTAESNKVPKKSNFLSSEFVHDSDEEDEFMDGAGPAALKQSENGRDTKGPNSAERSSQSKVSPKSNSSATATMSKTSPKTSANDARGASRPILASNRNTSTSSKTSSLARARNERSKTKSSRGSSSSQRTVSSLASSPPTNASDLESGNASSSSSSSAPLISVKNREKFDLGTLSSTNKRKRIDHETEIKGHRRDGSDDPYMIKRARANEMTPPFSDSPSPPSPRTIRAVAIEKARKFKQLYPVYEKLHRQMTAMDGSPSLGQIDRLEQLQNKLQRLKKRVTENCKGF